MSMRLVDFDPFCLFLLLEVTMQNMIFEKYNNLVGFN